MTQAAQHPALHPGRSAKIILIKDHQELELGFLGELHPKLQQHYSFTQAPILFEMDLEMLSGTSLPKLVEPSKFPSVERDLAIVLKSNVPAQSVLNRLKSEANELVKDIQLFDEFRPTPERSGGMQNDEKSLAFKIILSDDHQTLQDSTIENAIKQLLDQVLIQFSARLR